MSRVFDYNNNLNERQIMNNKEIQNMALLMLENIKIKYKELREVEKSNKAKGIVDKDLSDYLEYLRETDGLAFDANGDLI